ncbi:MAG: hypothetical protein RQ760_15715, partial [Sedimentisphaerales bacterium]|nr:hypothetical protein [Sedimentisphaerales bacterium]
NPKQTQFKPNSNPIQTQFKPNSNPIQTQFYPPKEIEQKSDVECLKQRIYGSCNLKQFFIS